MATLTEAQVTAALRAVDSGTGGLDVVARGWVKGLAVKKGHVTFALEVPPRLGPELEPVRAAAEKAVRALASMAPRSRACSGCRARNQKPTAPRCIRWKPTALR